VSIARELVERYGISRTKTADIMGLAPAAVTQYLKSSRGGAGSRLVESSDKARNLISELADDLVMNSEPSDIMLLKLCRACATVRAEGLICDLHKEAMPKLKEIETCSCSLGLLNS
jgi:predicted transcriptional regulator